MATGLLHRTFVRDTLLIIVGSLIFAVGLDCFEVPHGIAAGGASGLATILAKVLGDQGLFVPVGIQVLIINALLMVFVVREGGLRYAARTSLGIVASSLFIDLLAPVLPVLGGEDLILCALWGGVVCGLGLGIVFRAGGNTGGTDIVAQLISRHTSMSVGTASLFADMAVIALSIPVFGMEKALYACVALYLCARVLDMVLDGFNTQRAAYIISDKHDEIKRHVFDDLDRGCTELTARGGYTHVERPVLLVILGRSETALLKTIIAEVDPNAIVMIADVHEAFGEGFRSIETEGS